MARRRGRPPRAGERAQHRVELHLTGTERVALRRLAAANGIGVADLLRYAVNWLSAVLEEDGTTMLLVGTSIVTLVPPAVDLKELLPARICRGARHS
jgi:hypothetical protein